MSITIEFYAANPEAFVTLQKQLASPFLSEEEEQHLFRRPTFPSHWLGEVMFNTSHLQTTHTTQAQPSA